MLTCFETFCLNWYFRNVNQFTMEAGIMGDYIREIGYKGIERGIFLKALNMIHQNNFMIQNERAEMEMEKRRKG